MLIKLIDWLINRLKKQYIFNRINLLVSVIEILFFFLNISNNELKTNIAINMVKKDICPISSFKIYPQDKKKKI